MIVRILGEGQYEVPDSTKGRLNELDATLDRAVASKDEGAFATALAALIEAVRQTGNALDPSRLVPSDLAVPTAGSSLGEVLALLDTDATAGP